MNNQDNKIDISVEKLKRMILKIYFIERENSKTGMETDKRMKEKIQAIIEEEVKKCY